MTNKKMHANEVDIDATLVKQLLREQFPQWAELSIKPVTSAGTDNAIYRLGTDMCIRLPRISAAAKHIENIEKEQRWLSEVYGYKYARRAIWCGFLFNAIYIIYGQIVIHMPNPDFETKNAMFDSLLAINTRIILASGISYLVSEPLNSIVLAKLKIKMHGRFMAVRFLSSTIIAAGVDSYIFGTIAFYGAMSNKNLFYLIITMWFIKIAIELLGLPFSIHLSKKLKKIEGIDTYDKNTGFNIFSLNTDYTREELNLRKPHGY